MELTNQQRFEFLQLQFEDQSELLRSLIRLDFELLAGYVTLQVVLGAWLTNNSLGLYEKIGMAALEIVLTSLPLRLFCQSSKRRHEAFQIIREIGNDLGLHSDKSPFWDYKHFYFAVILATFACIFLIIFFASTCP